MNEDKKITIALDDEQSITLSQRTLAFAYAIEKKLESISTNQAPSVLLDKILHLNDDLSEAVTFEDPKREIRDYGVDLATTTLALLIQQQVTFGG